MLLFVLRGLLPEGLILRSIISSVLLLPHFSIFHSFLKNVVISNGEHMILEVADHRNVFLLRQKGRMSFKVQSTVQLFRDLIPVLLFLFLFPLPDNLSPEGRLFLSTPCLIPHSRTLSFPCVYYLRFLPSFLSI